MTSPTRLALVRPTYPGQKIISSVCSIQRLEVDLNDLVREVAFLEERLTLLERKVAEFLSGSFTNYSDSTLDGIDEYRPTGTLNIECNNSGLMISNSYPTEYDHEGNGFCWIGNDGPIQIILPVQSKRALNCRLRLQLHPMVDYSNLTVFVGGSLVDIAIYRETVPQFNLEFVIPSRQSRSANIILNLGSIRPSDFGENEDTRRLAARFFGAELSQIYNAPGATEGAKDEH